MTPGCPQEDTILAFSEGRLDADAVRDLESHARTCPSCTDLLLAAVRVAHGSATRAQAVQSHARAEIARGTAIGRYLVLAPVGRGGMGEVFAAYDPELDRKVALKLLHAEGESSGAPGRGRLLREAKAIARLSHPNVVVVYDAGTFDDRVFVAMEFVDGQTVASWLAERPRARREIIDVFLEAARGLSAAHEAGLVHRDFKPQNVMVTRASKVRVMDFGLARPIGDAKAEGEAEATAPLDPRGAHARWDEPLTQTGELLGTPLYMSPEQFQARRTDAKADQFSFCVALYQALYGAHPFRSDALGELMADVCAGNVRPPPPRSNVPAWLRRVLLRGLSVDPEQRWPSMTALAAALARDPVRARRRATLGAIALAGLVALGFGASRATRRPEAMCHAGASRLAGVWENAPGGARREQMHRAFLATGLGYAAETWDRVSKLLDDYAGRWVAMYRDSCEATQVRGEQSTDVLDLRTACLDERLTRVRALVDVFAAADSDTLAHAVDAASALPTLDRCADVKFLRSPVEPPPDKARPRVESLRTRAATVDALNLTGKHEPALKLGRQLVTEARALGYRPLLAELLARLWAFEDSAAYGREPIADLEEATWLALATRRDDIAAESTALLSGNVGYRLAEHEAGERWAALSKAILERLGPGNEVLRAWVLTNQASMRIQDNDLDSALALAREALAIKQRQLPPGSPDIAASANAVAEVLYRRGDAAGALEMSNLVRDTYRRAYGDGSPWMAKSLSNRGEYLAALGRNAEALAAFQDALGRWESQLGRTHPYLAYPLTGIGILHWKEHRAAEAIAPLERALAIRETGEPDVSVVAETRFALARALWDAARERPRARHLAATARANYQGPPLHAAEVREVDAWLASHDGA